MRRLTRELRSLTNNLEEQNQIVNPADQTVPVAPVTQESFTLNPFATDINHSMIEGSKLYLKSTRIINIFRIFIIWN